MQTETSEKLASVIECAHNAHTSQVKAKSTRNIVHSEERARLMLSVKAKKERKRKRIE